MSVIDDKTGWRPATEVRCSACGLQAPRGMIKRNDLTQRWMRRCDACFTASAAEPPPPADVADVVDTLADYAPPPPAITEAVALSPEQLAALGAELTQGAAQHFLQLVPELVRRAALDATREISITIADRPPVLVTSAHKMLPDILTAVVAGTSPFLVGPAGSGKTTLAEQVASTMGLKFYMASRVTSEHKLTGFIDAQGHYVRTQFRDAYEHGGLFLLDEVDSCDPDALTSFNAPLAGQWGDFPDGMVARHPDFRAIAAGNTFGRGADRLYVGRNQLDAATLDRFETWEVEYDEDLELQIAGNAEWTRYVQRVRKAVDAEKVRHVVSPRASIRGARLLAAGMERRKVEEACVWKGLAQTERSRVEYRMASMGAV